MNEMSFLLPHFLKDGRGKLDVYFTRVYNPVWTNPDGFSWIEVLTDESRSGCTSRSRRPGARPRTSPTTSCRWGSARERHDLHSYETHDAQWLGFRQPVLRAARERLGETVADTREVEPGRGVGGERVLDRADLAHRSRRRARHPPVLRVEARARARSSASTSTTARSSRTRCRAAGEGGGRGPDAARIHAALRRVRDRAQASGRVHEEAVPASRARGRRGRPLGPRLHARAEARVRRTSFRCPTPDPDARRPAAGRRASRRRGRCAASRRRAAGSSSIRARSPTGAGRSTRCPTYIKSHVHPDKPRGRTRCCSSPTFRLPVQIHTRSANAKWLDEIAHTNPLWIHPSDAATLGVRPAISCASRPRSATSS